MRKKRKGKRILINSKLVKKARLPLIEKLKLELTSVEQPNVRRRILETTVSSVMGGLVGAYLFSLLF